MPDNPGRDGVEDGVPAPDALDDQATQRIERPGRPGDPAPHEGWGRQPQGAYDAGDSGGWGGPSPHHTGPLPRLRRPESARPPTGRTPDEEVTFAPAQGFDAPDPDAADRFDDTGHAGTAGPGPAGAHPLDHRGGGQATAGLSTLFDLSFRRRATSSIVPFTYTVLLVFLLLDYMRSVYDYSSTAAGLGPGAVGGLLILFVVGFFKIVVVAAVARLALELCLNVADLARSRRGEAR